MVFYDPYMLTIILIVVVLLIIGNLYFLAHYAHYADSFFGSSAASKGLLVSYYLVKNLGYWVHARTVSNPDAWS